MRRTSVVVAAVALVALLAAAPAPAQGGLLGDLLGPILNTVDTTLETVVGELTTAVWKPLAVTDKLLTTVTTLLLNTINSGATPFLTDRDGLVSVDAVLSAQVQAALLGQNVKAVIQLKDEGGRLVKVQVIVSLRPVTAVVDAVLGVVGNLVGKILMFSQLTPLL